MSYLRAKKLVRTKCLLALTLVTSMLFSGINHVSAITYDSATSTYFDSVDDFGLASASESVGLQFGGTLGEFLRFNRQLDKFVFTDDLDVQGTISGSALTIMGNASVSGSLRLEGGTTLSGAALQGFGLSTDCDTGATSKLLWDATTGRFSCATDRAGSETGGQGLTFNGSSLSLNAFHTGSIIKASTTLASSGTLVFEGAASGASLYLGQKLEGAGLGDCDTSDTSKLLWDATTGRFSCGTDETGPAASTGSYITVQNSEPSSSLTASTEHDIFTDAKFPGGTLNYTTKQSSGITFTPSNGRFTVAASGTYLISFQLTATIASTAATNVVNFYLNGTNMYAQDNFTNHSSFDPLVYTFSTVKTLATNDYVNIKLIPAGTATTSSGTSVTMFRLERNSGNNPSNKAGQGLTLASRSFKLSSAFSGASLILSSSFSGAGLTDCNAGIASKLLWDATTAQFSCGTDDADGVGLPQASGDERYVQQGGDTMTGALTISVTSGSNTTFGLKILNALSGSFIHAEKSLSSSGTLTWEGIGTGSRLNLSTGLSIGGTQSGALLTLTRFMTGSKSTLFSVDQMGLAELEGGAYFGRTGLTEDKWGLSNYGNTWSAKDSNRNWTGIGMSSDGKYQTAVVYNSLIYVSSDYGNTWTSKGSSNRLWYDVAMSEDGKFQTAVAEGITATSYDYGATWTETAQSIHARDVDMSADGKIQMMVGYGEYVYVSYDYGKTWTVKTISRQWAGAAMSSDGKIMAATTTNANIYISYDYGITWTAKATVGMWNKIAMSDDGKYMTAGPSGGTMYRSTDYGETWVATAGSKTWNGLAMSSNGKIQIGGAQSDSLYLSTDFGVTWVAKGSALTYYSISMSSDGKIISAATYGSQIYVSHADTYQFGSVGIGTGANLLGRQTIFTDDAFDNAALVINSDETTATQNMFTITTDVGSTNDLQFRITASGAVYSDARYNSAGADYAEWFKTSGPLPMPGDVVCINVEEVNTVKRCDRDGDDTVMGIVSTNPGFIGNTFTGADGIIPPGYALVGLIGQVPTRVTIENGESIRAGDSLTSASIPGYARKARPYESTVGMALEPLESGKGTINVLIVRRNWSATAAAMRGESAQRMQTDIIDSRIKHAMNEAMRDLNVSNMINREVAPHMMLLRE